METKIYQVMFSGLMEFNNPSAPKAIVISQNE